MDLSAVTPALAAELVPPEDPTDHDAWLEVQEREFGEAFATLVGELAEDAAEQYRASLTAAGDASVFDAGASKLRAAAQAAGEWLTGMHLAGSLSAWVAAPGVPPSVGDGWAKVVNESAVAYQRGATNRIVGASQQLWRDVRDRTVTAVNVGVDNESLTRAIENVTGYSEFRANTIARTETVAAYNGGDMAGMRTLNELGGWGPVEKVWVATRDSRTRRDHSRAHNQVVPMDDPFDVGGRRMDRPHASGAPPEQVVNCRCVVEYLFDGDTRPDGSVVGADVEPEPEDVPPPIAKPKRATRKPKWQTEARRAGKKVISSEDISRSGYERLTRSSRSAKSPWARFKPGKRLMTSEVNMRKAGRVLDRRVDERMAGRGYPVRMIDAQARDVRLAKLKGKATRLYTKRKAREAGFSDEYDWMDAEGLSFHDVREMARREDGRVAALHRAQQDVASVLDDVAGYERALAEETMEALRELRPLGAFDADGNANLSLLNADGTEAMRELTTAGRNDHGLAVYRNASQHYPTEWVQESNRHPLAIGTVRGSEANRRGFHRAVSRNVEDGAVIHIPYDRRNDVGLAVHEFGHHMEQVTPALRAHEWAFIRRRAAEQGTRAPKKLSQITGNKAYRDSEVAWDIGSPYSKYAGKEYGNGPDSYWEVFTMGMENLVQNGLWKDQDMREFVLGALVSL